MRFSLDETFDVSEDYRVPFRFTDKLEKVTIDLKYTVRAAPWFPRLHGCQ